MSSTSYKTYWLKSDGFNKMPFMAIKKANYQNIFSGRLSEKLNSTIDDTWFYFKTKKTKQQRQSKSPFLYQLLAATNRAVSLKFAALWWDSLVWPFLNCFRKPKGSISSLVVISLESFHQCVIFNRCCSLVCLFKCKIKALAWAHGTTGGSEKQRWGKMSVVCRFQYWGWSRFPSPVQKGYHSFIYRLVEATRKKNKIKSKNKKQNQIVSQ